MSVGKPQEEIVKLVNDYMQANRYCNRTDIVRALNIGRDRLEKLHSDGLVKLPPKMSRSIASTYGRKKRKLGVGWTIKKAKI